MRSAWAIQLSLFLLMGCKHPEPSAMSGAALPQEKFAPLSAKRTHAQTSAARPTANIPRVTPVLESKGKVVAVNLTLRFVVIDFYTSQLPQNGERMNVYRQGLKVGEVKISGPERSRNIAADIVAGEAQVSDEVRPD